MQKNDPLTKTFNYFGPWHINSTTNNKYDIDLNEKYQPTSLQ